MCSSFAESYPIGLPVCHQHLCLVKLMSIQLVMPSNCFFQCCPFLPLLSILSGTKKISSKNPIQCYGNHTRWRSRRRCPYFLLGEVQNYNSVLNNQENVRSHQKKITQVQGQRRSPSQIVGRAKFCLESKPIPAHFPWRAQTKPCAHQGSETPHRLSQNCI